MCLPSSFVALATPRPPRGMIAAGSTSIRASDAVGGSIDAGRYFQ